MASENPHHEADPTAIKDDKENGKKRITFKPRGLNIVWGKDRRYWNVPEQNDAELLQVCWLEVTGSADVVPGKKYEVTFNLSLTPDAFGWDDCPVYVLVKSGANGKFVSAKRPLSDHKDKKESFSISSYELESKDAKLYFGLYEVWTGKWKGGLKIHEVIVKETN